MKPYRLPAWVNALSEVILYGVYKQTLRVMARLPDFKLEFNTLTPREFEVAKLLAEGYSSDQIERKLYIGRRTRESHLYNAIHKLGVENRYGLIKIFKERGESLLSISNQTQAELRRRQQIARIIGCSTHATLKYIKENGFTSSLECLNYLSTTTFLDKVTVINTAPDIPFIAFNTTETAANNWFNKYLTPQEYAVASLVAKSLTNAQIAIQLDISRRTVEANMYNIFKKLNIKNRTQLAALMLSNFAASRVAVDKRLVARLNSVLNAL